MNEILNEVYFGEAAVQPIYEKFSIVRQKFYGKTFSTTMNIDKDVLKFNRAVENFFGYETFSLNVSPDSALNAYAWPIGVYRTEEQKKKMISSLTSTKSGFRHDPKYGQISAICTINMGLINSTNFSDKEIFAVLLHEMGHTFFYSVVGSECKFNINKHMLESLKKINECINKVFMSGEDKVSDKTVEKDIDKSFGDKAKAIFEKIKNKSLSFIKVASIMQTVDALKKKKFIKKKFFGESMNDNMVDSRIDYTNEKFADTFATMYGYGGYLHTALEKFSTIAYAEIGIHQPTGALAVALKVSHYMFNDLLAYIMNVKDEHPDGLTRLKVSVEYLKKEIAREGLDPKMKLQLVAQLDEMNKLIDDYINFPKSEDNIKVIRTYYTKLYEKFGGDRREQDTDNDALFDVIDKRYNDLQDKKG